VEALFTVAIRHLNGYQGVEGARQGAQADCRSHHSSPTRNSRHGAAHVLDGHRIGYGVPVAGGWPLPHGGGSAPGGGVDALEQGRGGVAVGAAMEGKARLLLKEALLGRGAARFEQGLVAQSVADADEAGLLN
jgi:hypothetical protein